MKLVIGRSHKILISFPQRESREFLIAGPVVSVGRTCCPFSRAAATQYPAETDATKHET